MSLLKHVSLKVNYVI